MLFHIIIIIICCILLYYLLTGKSLKKYFNTFTGGDLPDFSTQRVFPTQEGLVANILPINSTDIIRDGYEPVNPYSRNNTILINKIQEEENLINTYTFRYPARDGDVNDELITNLTMTAEAAPDEEIKDQISIFKIRLGNRQNPNVAFPTTPISYMIPTSYRNLDSPNKFKNVFNIITSVADHEEVKNELLANINVAVTRNINYLRESYEFFGDSLANKLLIKSNNADENGDAILNPYRNEYQFIKNQDNTALVRRAIANPATTTTHSIESHIIQFLVVAGINEYQNQNAAVQPLEIGEDGMFIIGDIHGDLASLMISLQLYLDVLRTNPKCILFFIGDYVDRGFSSFAVLDIITTLKILFPKRVFLGRGNHESADMQFNYTKYPHSNIIREIVNLYPKATNTEIKRLIYAIYEFYASLSVAYLVNNSFIFVHGALYLEFTTQDIQGNYYPPNTPSYYKCPEPGKKYALYMTPITDPYPPTLVNHLPYISPRPNNLADKMILVSTFGDFPIFRHRSAQHGIDVCTPALMYELSRLRETFKRVCKGHDHQGAMHNTNDRIKTDIFISSLTATIWFETLFDTPLLKTDNQLTLKIIHDRDIFTFATSCGHLKGNGRLRRYSFEQYATNGRFMKYIYQNMRHYYLEKYGIIPSVPLVSYYEIFSAQGVSEIEKWAQLEQEENRKYCPVDYEILFFLGLVPDNISVSDISGSCNILNTLIDVMFGKEVTYVSPFVENLAIQHVISQTKEEFENAFFHNGALFADQKSYFPNGNKINFKYATLDSLGDKYQPCEVVE